MGIEDTRMSEECDPVLDLKDAAFCIPVDEQSQTIFAFEWENPATGRKTQLCWTVLPQGFKNSPTLFGNVLAKELELWQNDHDAVTLLQYVDDLLIGSDSYEACLEAIISLLNFLGLAGYLNQKTPIPLDTPVHPFQPGDTVYVQTWKDEPLKEKWKGPHTVLLKTYTAVKVDGIDSWIHYTRVKKAPDQDKWTSMPTGELRLRLTRDCQ
ncbi:hypothetical protein QYF61_015709 [Mycteria americana]|uniref:ribonuclease H n=1 Tax=Mycteria americana TaxID=33587 RepID=A0AAN7RKP4_MYCAM|nr:hypothetical protein QYF61_007494 [Mycteria americana]KAK4811005.1 hypothetical protein QYF61_015709 [Mycteria americana]